MWLIVWYGVTTTRTHYNTTCGSFSTTTSDRLAVQTGTCGISHVLCITYGASILDTPIDSSIGTGLFYRRLPNWAAPEVTRRTWDATIGGVCRAAVVEFSTHGLF